jgi:hypothetical protein
MKEELSSFETSVLTRVTWLNIPEDVIILRGYLLNPRVDGDNMDQEGSGWKE